jgi:hypothetical protein
MYLAVSAYSCVKGPGAAGTTLGIFSRYVLGMESVRVIQKPKSCGRFSHEREVWDLIHQDRFNRWLEGDPIEAIAEKHHVTCRSVHLSVAKIMAGLHQKYRSQALQFRSDNRNAWKAQVAALEAFRALTDPSNLFAAIPVRGAQRARSRKHFN